ncbi:MAG: SsrA-binding protein SmpB [Spirochaetales bacterium]|nr:SsrA-binding protein SmpB [Spirochaetales bacterium]
MAESDSAPKKNDVKVLAVNKKARFEYEVIENLECGLELAGTEVKSIKAGQFSFADAYAKVENDELWLVALHVTPYVFGNIHNREPARQRKLLAHKQEIKRLKRKTDEKGLTLVPMRFYLKKGIVKVEIATCRGKKLHDKRQSIKARDVKRDIDRDFRKRI